MGVKAEDLATEIAAHDASGHVQVYVVKVILFVESRNTVPGDTIAGVAIKGNLQPSVGLVTNGNL